MVLGGFLGIGGDKSSSDSSFTQTGTKLSSGVSLEDTTQATKQTTDTQQTQTQTQTEDQTRNLSQQDLQFVESLDQDTQDLLKAFLADTATSNDAKGLSDFIANRAVSGDMTESIAAIVENARFQGEQDIGRAVTGNANLAGSTLNSFVQQTAGEQYADLNVQLAGLEGELAFKAREIETAELSAALEGIIGAEAGKTGNVVGIADVLKGATQQTTGTTEQQTALQSQTQSETLASIVEALSALQTGTARTKTGEVINLDASGTGTTSSKSLNFGLGISGGI